MYCRSDFELCPFICKFIVQRKGALVEICRLKNKINQFATTRFSIRLQANLHSLCIHWFINSGRNYHSLATPFKTFSILKEGVLLGVYKTAWARKNNVVSECQPVDSQSILQWVTVKFSKTYVKDEMKKLESVRLDSTAVLTPK